MKELFISYLKDECNVNEAEQVIELLAKKNGQDLMAELLDRNSFHANSQKNNTGTEKSWNQIAIKIFTTNQPIENIPPTAGRVVSFRPIRLWWAAAAAIVPLLIIGSYWFSKNNSANQNIAVIEKTDFGQTKTIALSDGSEVVLNGNSSLKYSQNWNDTQPREVWLDGEAFFKITHQKNNQKFLVHTTHRQTIEVLGTEFNVSDRMSKVSVVLKSGKIKLIVQQKQEIKSLIMKPGERVEMDTAAARVKVNMVKPEIYTSWQSHKLVFEKTKLSDIALMLNETYNLKVIVENPQLLNEKISGTIPSGNINELINALSIALQVKYTQDSNTVKFY